MELDCNFPLGTLHKPLPYHDTCLVQPCSLFAVAPDLGRGTRMTHFQQMRKLRLRDGLSCPRDLGPAHFLFATPVFSLFIVTVVSSFPFCGRKSNTPRE